jgi:hypothetical protein
MPQSALQQGVGDLIMAAMGGGRLQQNAQLRQQMAYDQADTMRAGLDEKISQARQRRLQLNAQEGIADDLAKLFPGASPDQTGAYAHVLQGDYGKLGDVRKDTLQSAALAALSQNPNLMPGNAELAVLHGQPISDVNIDGGQVITHQYGAAPTVAPTAADAALAEARQASARLHNVQADAGGYNPHTGRGVGAAIIQALTPGGHPSYQVQSKPISEAQAVIDDARGQGEDMTGYSPVDVAHALRGGAPFVPLHNGAGTMRFIEGTKAPYSVPIKPGTQGALPAQDSGSGIADLVLGALHNLLPGSGTPQAAPAAAAPAYTHPLLDEARAAIAKGANPAAVKQRLAATGHADLAGML